VGNNPARPATILITGIPASGKSTLGKRLRDDLIKSGITNVKLIDGEVIREALEKQGKHYGYSTAERNELSLQKAYMSLKYNQQGIICIVCAICHTRAIREEMRAIIGNFMEVYLDCPADICAQRDYKGHYLKAFQGLYDNFIGVTEPYQESGQLELVLHTGSDPIDGCAQTLLNSVMDFLKKPENKAEDLFDNLGDAIGVDK